MSQQTFTCTCSRCQQNLLRNQRRQEIESNKLYKNLNKKFQYVTGFIVHYCKIFMEFSTSTFMACLFIAYILTTGCNIICVYDYLQIIIYCLISLLYRRYELLTYAPSSIKLTFQQQPTLINTIKTYNKYCTHYQFYKLWTTQGRLQYNDGNKNKVFKCFYFYNSNNIKLQYSNAINVQDYGTSIRNAIDCLSTHDINDIFEYFTHERWEEYMGYTELCDFFTALEHPQILKRFFMDSQSRFIDLLCALLQISQCSCRLEYKYKIYIRILRILLVIKFLSSDIHIYWVSNSGKFYEHCIVEFMKYYNENKMYFDHPYSKCCFGKQHYGFEFDPVLIAIYAYFCTFYYERSDIESSYTFQYVDAGLYKQIVNFTGLNESYCYLQMKDKYMNCNYCGRKYFDEVYQMEFIELKFEWDKKYKLKKVNKWYKCSACQIVYYCSRKCQKRDWNFNGHRNICNSI